MSRNSPSGPSDSALELLLFWNGPAAVGVVEVGKFAGLVVDCEHIGKPDRQAGFDTEINTCTPADVGPARQAAPGLDILCRINGFGTIGAAARDEARRAVDAGATEILLPMVQSFEEIETLLRAVQDHVAVSIMVETEWAVGHARELDAWPLRRVFVGLNDLMIQRNSRHLFENVTNGTVERLREEFQRIPFGFGGVTLPERGAPVPCRLLMAEMARLRCHFTFLRRSFYRDVRLSGESPARAAELIHAEWRRLEGRAPAEVAEDHAECLRAMGASLRAT